MQAHSEQEAFRRVFAATLRNLKESMELSASQLASKLGVSRQALSMYMHGKSVPGADVFVRALKLGLPFEGIYCRDDAKHQLALFEGQETAEFEAAQKNVSVLILRRDAHKIEMSVQISLSPSP